MAESADNSRQFEAMRVEETPDGLRVTMRSRPSRVVVSCAALSCLALIGIGALYPSLFTDVHEGASWWPIIGTVAGILFLLFINLYFIRGWCSDVLTLGEEVWLLEFRPWGRGKPEEIDVRRIVGIMRHSPPALWMGDRVIRLSPAQVGAREDRDWLAAEIRRRLEALSQDRAAFSASEFGSPRPPKHWEVEPGEAGSVTVNPPGFRQRLRIHRGVIAASCVLMGMGGFPLIMFTIHGQAAFSGVLQLCFYSLFGFVLLSVLHGLWAVVVQCYAQWRVRPGCLEYEGGWFRFKREFQPPARLIVTHLFARNQGQELDLWVQAGEGKRYRLLQQQQADEALAVGRWLSEQTGFPLEPPWEPV